MGWLCYILSAASIALQVAFASECACATGNVHVRSGAGVSNSILGTLPLGQCLRFRGHMNTISGTHWANVDYNGQSAWISASYVTFRECQTVSTTPEIFHVNNTCPNIISRAEWGARAPSSHIGSLVATPKYVYIHHGATPGCSTKSECIQRVKSYQNYHMDSHGWSDIGYSFLVGEDGNIYQARGWDEIGSHTYGHNTDGLGVCFIGDFTSRVPNDAALAAVHQLISCGVSMDKIQANYILKGHRDVGHTACPGDKLYQLIQSWSHYHK